MNLAFIGPMKHAGLSLSIGLAACINAGLLYWQLRKRNHFQPKAGWRTFFIKLIIALLVMTAALLGMVYLMPAWDEGNMLMRILRLLAVVITGVVAYFGSLAAMGFRIRDFARRGV